MDVSRESHSAFTLTHSSDALRPCAFTSFRRNDTQCQAGASQSRTLMSGLRERFQTCVLTFFIARALIAASTLSVGVSNG
jgi:hypothetical protein